MFNYCVCVNQEDSKIEIAGVSRNGHHFELEIIKTESNYVEFRKGKSALDCYENHIFTGGEWKYFEKQLKSYQYILGHNQK